MIEVIKVVEGSFYHFGAIHTSSELCKAFKISSRCPQVSPYADSGTSSSRGWSENNGTDDDSSDSSKIIIII